MRLIAIFIPTSLGATQSVSSARALLNGTSPALTRRRSPLALVRRLLAQLARRRGLPLRFAAHFLTVGIVLLAVLSPALAHSLVAPASLGGVAPRARAAIDLQVSREIDAQARAGDAGLLQPLALMANAEELPAFVDTHEVFEGETLGQIATQYGVSVASLFWANDLGTENVFAAGQELRVPRLSGLPYIIEEGDTLDALAARFGVRTQAITLFKPNAIDASAPLPVGREIYIPGGVSAYPDDLLMRVSDAGGVAALTAVAAGTVRESETNLRAGPGRDYPKLGVLDAGRRLKLVARHEQWVKVEDSAGQLGWVRGDLLGLSPDMLANLTETNDFPPPPPRWVWPTHGEITSRFGWRSVPFRSFHDGLDIANAAWTKIYAARTGRVYEAGWCSGFGYCVKIDHGDGITTIYGHLIKKPPVSAGTNVEAGELIGYMGSTYDRSGGGYSTGVHLHFTVKVNGKAVNPLKFLP